MSDEPKRPDAETTRPPPNLDDGDDDLYSASTKVGEVSPELLAIVRDVEQGKAAKAGAARVAEPAKPVSEGEAKLAAMMETAARSAKQAAANEIARDRATTAAPPPPVASEPPEPVAPARRTDTSPRHAARAAEEQEPEGLSPLVGIVLVFAAASLVLAALVR